MTPLRLHYAPDNASLCVRLALEACGIAYETVLVDRRAGGQRRPSYLALNPNGLIPTLETPEGPLFETAAILLWLAEQPGGAGLMPPPGAAGRGPALTWLVWLANTPHPRLRMLFYPDRYIDAGQASALERGAREGIAAALDLLEGEAARGPDWLRPGAASAHVAYLCPMLRWCALYPRGRTEWFDLGRWPVLEEIAKVTEGMAWARAAAAAEGLGPAFFSRPEHCNPPEGSAT